MRKRKPLDLASLDDKLLDGLKFCLKVYDLLEQIHAEPDGIGKIRLLKSKREKRLLEELIPIAQYIQARYRPGNRLKIRWLSGSQPYDAIIWTPLKMVRHGGLPRKMFVEVTTSQHENTHLSRKLLHETGGSPGPKGIRVNRETGTPDVAPYVYSGSEHITDLAQQILSRIGGKAQKNYPPNTVLIVNCQTDGIVLQDEWATAVNEVERAALDKPFRETFLYASRGNHSATLWGLRKSRK